MPNSPSNVKSIFGQALDMQSPPERAKYLDEACQGNVALRAEIEDLIGAVARAGDFLAQSSPGEQTFFDKVHEGVGALISPYKLLQEIGEGGFGVVFMAEQTQPVQRKVALKIIKPGMDSRQVIARFEAERQALALMDHPNIARVFDAGTTDSGRPYFVMELVKGVPITEYCDLQKQTPPERLKLFIDVCRAVQHAHQKGIIHRDLKPSNIMVTMHDDRPVPKIIDFGISKAISQRLTEKTLFTAFGQMVGTPMYMSPEQAQLSGLDVDTRSDVYSLGVVLYELVTGTTPFDETTLKRVGFDEMRRMIREEEPLRPSARVSTLKCDLLLTVADQRKIDPRKLSQSLRGEVDWIVTKALEKDRNRRFESANSLAQDIERYLNDEPVQARPPSSAYRLRKFARRNRGPVLSVFLVLLALVGGMIGTTWNMIRATKAQAVAVNEAQQKEAALLASQQSERHAKDKLWMSLYERARAGRFSRQLGQRLDSLAALADAARIRPDAALRDAAIAAMALPDVRRVPVRHSSPTGTTAAYGARYRLYARADNQGFISIRSIADDQEIQRIASGPIRGAIYLYFSPDERFLAGRDHAYTLHVWRVADGERALRDEIRECRAHAFSPDGRRLAVGQHEWVLSFDLATGQEVNRWSLPAPAHTLAFHPDNGKLAVGYFRVGVASVYDAASGALLTDLPVGGMTNQVVAWHPDGERLAVAGSDPRIQIWNVAAKRKVATLEGHVQYVPALTFHPGGDLLASSSWDGLLRLWDPSTGRPLLQLPLIVGDYPQFSSDGRWLGAALHGEQTQLLEVTPSREYRTLVSSAGFGVGGYNHGDLSPDGRVLAVAMDPGARLWDLPSGRELAALPAWTNFVFFDWSGGAGFQPATSAEDKRQAESLPHILTSGSDGLLRWPVTSDDPQRKHLILGPPRRLSALRRAWFARSPDGRTLAAATEEGGANKILDLETGTVGRDLGIHPNGEVRALSADGRWAASSGWYSDRVRLWNAETGQMVNEWVVGTRTYVFFTPDSRTLIISRGDEFSFWDVATLQPTLRLRRDVTQYPGHVAFSRDGKLMAVEMAPAIIHLMEVANSRTVAKLEDPHGDRASWQAFTPDGTQLVVVAKYATAIHIWDLRAIRTRLKEMNLDWDWPEFPPAVQSPHAPPEESIAHAEPHGYTIDVVVGDPKKD